MSAQDDLVQTLEQLRNTRELERALLLEKARQVRRYWQQMRAAGMSRRQFPEHLCCLLRERGWTDEQIGRQGAGVSQASIQRLL